MTFIIIGERGVIVKEIRGKRLFNRGAGEDVELVRVGRRDAGEDFVIGGGTDHGGVVTGELRLGEENLNVAGKGGGGLGAEGLIRTDAAGEDDSVNVGVGLEGGL